MTGRDPRYDILFEPVRIGPVTAPNRFYQVPHCTGFGYAFPNALIGHRRVKAEGGWGVVSTEMCEIHPSSDVMPYIETRIWDDSDIAHHARMTEAVHEHGALAAIELAHGGIVAQNLYSRVPPMGPASLANPEPHVPTQSKRMSGSDIADLRRWHRQAAERAVKAGFDLVYVYASHNMGIPGHFISRRYNDRTDEYGGSLENRTRLLRELIEDTKEAVGDRCGVVVRLGVEDFIGSDGITPDEARDVIAMLAELPDLWDVNVNDWPMDSSTSRFEGEGFQEPFISFVKSVTTRPVVGVGRFTSPDTMVSQIRRGIIDMIGAARPSIADPFLPKKIAEGRVEDIRECIGCNICVSGDIYHVPMRCTQNPTVGEEWRRDWHPERFAPGGSDSHVLVVGAGPSGLECALTLARRGYGVTLAEARGTLGGRVADESALPGLSAWGRVRDHRQHQLRQMANVAIYPSSRLEASDVRDFGISRVVVATGSIWRRDGIGPSNHAPVPGHDRTGVLTPDDLHAGKRPQGAVLVFDDDHFYLGGVIAELLRAEGCDVTLVTPNPMVSAFTANTLEQPRIQAHLIESGIRIETALNLAAIHGDHVLTACAYTGRQADPIACDHVVFVTSRLPEEGLWLALDGDRDSLREAGIASLDRIGDCVAPSTIAAAVHAGHTLARGFDGGEAPFRREHVVVGGPAS